MVGRKATEKTEVEDDDNRGGSKKTKVLYETEERRTDEQHDYQCESDQEFEEGDRAQPIGEVLRVSNDGVEKKKHFKAFEFDGNRFQLEDTILVAPEEGKVKPSVTIIKRFYRPEEAKNKAGGTWESRDARELFYSYHLDEVPSNAVMHKCVIHFVPLHKPLLDRKQHPGFIVRKFYDYVEQKVRNLTDKECKCVLPDEHRPKE